MIEIKEKMNLRVDTIRSAQQYYSLPTALVTAIGMDGEEVSFIAKADEWYVGDVVSVEIVKRVDKI